MGGAPGGGTAVAISTGFALAFIIATPMVASIDLAHAELFGVNLYYFWAVELFLLATLFSFLVAIRAKLRARDQIAERCCETNTGVEDVGVTLACLPCATCQMARHELG